MRLATAPLCSMELSSVNAARCLGPGVLVVLTPGGRVSITAAPDRPVDVALLGGAPVQGPVLFAGSFVMDIPQRITQARRDFASGKMGTLDGVPF